MQFAPEEANLEKISSEISAITAIKNIHHVHIWQLNDKELHFEAHVEFIQDIPLTEFQKHLIEIDEILKKYDIHHCNIQPEYQYCENRDLIVSDK